MSKALASTIVAILVLASIAILLGACATPDSDWASIAHQTGKVIR